jgi:methionyl aminopeptidase
VTSEPDTTPLTDPERVRGVREAASIAKVALDYADELIAPGVTGDEIDAKIHEFLVGMGAYPAPLNYMGFPKSICFSVNEVVVHGIPDSRPLEDGDIVKIDVSCYTENGFFGDNCRSYLVGEVDEAGRKLVQRTRQMLWKAVAECGPGRELRAIGDVVSAECAKYGYDTVRQFCGHGIGAGFHMDPLIHHYAGGWNAQNNRVMTPGMCFTIEPMITEGSQENITLDDGWTIVTTDGGRAAQFEHTVLITETGAQVLT